MKKNLKLVGLTAATITCIVIIIVLLINQVSGNSTPKTTSECLDMGNSYLQELDYEQAIAYFKSAIEIDARCVDAYVKLAETYTQMNEFDKAIEILEEGISIIEDKVLTEKLEEVKVLYTNLQLGIVRYFREDYTGGYRMVYFDANDNAVKMEFYEDEHLKEYDLLTYNENNDVIKKEFYSAKGKLRCSNEYIYEDNRIIIKVYNFGSSTTITSHPDKKAPIIRTEFYNKKGILTSTDEFFYDDNGNSISTHTYGYIYDDNGNLTRTRESFYDDKHELVKYIDYDSEGEMYRYFLPIYNDANERIGDRCYYPDGTLDQEYFFESSN